MGYHWTYDATKEKVLEVEKVYTNDNNSDMMTRLSLNFADHKQA